MAMIVPTNVIGSQSLSIQKLMIGHQFAVPSYQRDFEWEEDEFEKLWSDLTWTHSKNFQEDGKLICQLVIFLER